jgi:hypothetical protein
MHACPTCGHDAPEPYDEAAELARLDALATALGVPRAKVNPATLEAAGKVAGVAWHGVTPERLVGKPTAVRKAVGDALAKARP